MNKIIFGLLLLVSVTLTAGVPYTPNPEISPGGICHTEDRDFKEFRYRERIPYCKRKVSKSLKTRLYEIYGIPKHCRSSYTIDHIVPLSLGGNNAPENLWPEHVSVKALRQNLEYDLYLNLKNGHMTQEQAINIIMQAKYYPQIPPNFRPSPNCPNK
jgi:hypothetical protein